MHEVRFRIDHCGSGVLSVNGVSLEKFVRGFELKSKGGAPAELVLDVVPAIIDGQTAIELHKLGIMMDGKLTWTTEKPARVGMYWWRNTTADEPEIVKVRWWLGWQSKDSESDHLRVYRFEQGDGEYNNELVNFLGEWAGPLEVPE